MEGLSNYIATTLVPGELSRAASEAAYAEIQARWAKIQEQQV